MSWAPKDLEDELFDDFSNCTLQEPPSYFKPVTEKHIPIIIKKLDIVKESKDETPKEVSSTSAEMSLTQSLRMYGIESSDDIPKSSSLSACVIKNDFSDPKHPLILEERYFTMKSEHHPCTSNQANKTRALPKKSVCDQQLCKLINYLQKCLININKLYSKMNLVKRLLKLFWRINVQDPQNPVKKFHFLQ